MVKKNSFSLTISLKHYKPSKDLHLWLFKKLYTIWSSGIPATDSIELKQQLHESDCFSILA